MSIQLHSTLIYIIFVILFQTKKNLKQKTLNAPKKKKLW